MLSTSDASTKAFFIEQYNQRHIAIAVFTDIVCGHEYPAKCVEVLDSGNDLACNDNDKPKAKKRPASSDGGKPKMPKKDSKYYGNILKAKSDCGASDNKLPFPKSFLAWKSAFMLNLTSYYHVSRFTSFCMTKNTRGAPKSFVEIIYSTYTKYITFSRDMQENA